MASCKHLRDGPAHGIADHYGLVQGERPYELGQVVGARFNIERGSPLAEAAMAPKVRGDSVERLPQGIEGAVPVQSCRCHPAVDEQHDDAAQRKPDGDPARHERYDGLERHHNERFIDDDQRRIAVASQRRNGMGRIEVTKAHS